MNTITFTFAWWWLPTSITVFMSGYALFVFFSSRGVLSKLFSLLIVLPAILVSSFAWIAALIIFK